MGRRGGAEKQRGRSSRSSPGSSCSLRGSHHDQQRSRQWGRPSGAQRSPRRASAGGEAFVARQELRRLRQGVSLPRLGTRGHERGQGAWGGGGAFAAVIAGKARRSNIRLIGINTLPLLGEEAGGGERNTPPPFVLSLLAPPPNVSKGFNFAHELG